MIFSRYNYPLPNNGTGYSFSEQELVKLLDSVYERGYTHGVEATNKTETTVACSNNATVSDEWQTYVDAVGGKTGLIDKAIDEIKLLENIMAAEKYPDSVCISFRKDMCICCLDADYCPKSKMAIVECPKFDDYINTQGER